MSPDWPITLIVPPLVAPSIVSGPTAVGSVPLPASLFASWLLMSSGVAPPESLPLPPQAASAATLRTAKQANGFLNRIVRFSLFHVVVLIPSDELFIGESWGRRRPGSSRPAG